MFILTSTGQTILPCHFPQCALQVDFSSFQKSETEKIRLILQLYNECYVLPFDGSISDSVTQVLLCFLPRRTQTWLRLFGNIF